MKFKRHLAPIAGALLLVTGAASVALIGVGGSASAAGEPSSAFGIDLRIADNAVIEETPKVVSTDGSKVTDEMIDVDPLNPLLSGGVVQVEAENGHALANVTGLGVGDGLLAHLPPELTTALDDVCTQLTDALNPVTGPVDEALVEQLLPGLDSALEQIGNSTAESPIDLTLLGGLDITKLTNLQLAGLCDVLAGNAPLISLGTVIAECTGDEGDVTVESGTLLGLPLEIDVAEDSTLEIPGLIKVVANEQTANADGTYTVDALNITLLGEIHLVVASATCGEVTSDEVGPVDAPRPTPIETNAPVTG